MKLSSLTQSTRIIPYIHNLGFGLEGLHLITLMGGFRQRGWDQEVCLIEPAEGDYTELLSLEIL